MEKIEQSRATSQRKIFNFVEFVNLKIKTIALTGSHDPGGLTY